MENMFENAYFGRSYKTRDGRKTIYLGESEYFELAVSDGDDYYYTLNYNFKGEPIEHLSSNDDIVSEWQEEIDEEELDELAINLIYEILDDFQDGEKVTFNLLKDLVKAGYRKAMEKLWKQKNL